MNEIYLMRDEKRDCVLFKAGFAKKLDDRIYQYTTHNPMCECISHVKTQESSRHKVEKIFDKPVSINITSIYWAPTMGLVICQIMPFIIPLNPPNRPKR